MNVFAKVHAYFSNPKRWTQNALARRKNGAPLKTGHFGRIAYCHCAFGAMRKFNAAPEELELLQEKAKEMYNHGFVYVNDALGYMQIMHVLGELSDAN